MKNLLKPFLTGVIATSLCVSVIVSCELLLVIALGNVRTLQTIISVLLLGGVGVFVSMLPYFAIGFGASLIPLTHFTKIRDRGTFASVGAIVGVSPFFSLPDLVSLDSNLQFLSVFHLILFAMAGAIGSTRFWSLLLDREDKSGQQASRA